MDKEYLFTLEEIKIALKMGVESALLVLGNSTDRTPDEIQQTADIIINMIEESLNKKSCKLSALSL
jgi:hypothetical protein